MILPTTIQSTLQRHWQSIDTALRASVEQILATIGTDELKTYYGQMQYHLGWVDASLQPTRNNPGKLLRPTLLLLAYEAAGAWGLVAEHSKDTTYLQRALPAAVAVEFTHNFTLIHDDIEDGDTERRHRPTLWTVWNTAQAINTGDGMFALARFALWDLLAKGVDSAIATRLAALLDRTTLTLAEGQYLDISSEDRPTISVAMYIDMIGRKTAALISCAIEMGARLGTTDQKTIDRLRSFGKAIGIAFQIRDDLLGIWATSSELGKTQAGDIYHRKKSLPILHALQHATPKHRHRLQEIYQQQTLSPEHVEEVLNIFQYTQTRDYCRAFLQDQCHQAYAALASVPNPGNAIATRALQDMQTVINYIEEVAH
jgi:geranylgeranyl diphosphate synthase, type I